jgi:hypothetical protein
MNFGLKRLEDLPYPIREIHRDCPATDPAPMRDPGGVPNDPELDRA